MKALVICGKIGSGKDAVADRLIEKYGYTKLQLSDMLAREMEKQGMPVSRENFQQFTQDMKNKFGKGVWGQKAIEFIEKNKLEKVVILGMRDSAEVEIFRKIPGLKIICVKASPETRLERLTRRGSKKDIKDMEGLRKQEVIEVEIFDIYNKYEELADFILDNEGTWEELNQKVDELVQKENLI